MAALLVSLLFGVLPAGDAPTLVENRSADTVEVTIYWWGTWAPTANVTMADRCHIAVPLDQLLILDGQVAVIYSDWSVHRYRCRKRTITVREF